MISLFVIERPNHILKFISFEIEIVSMVILLEPFAFSNEIWFKNALKGSEITI